MKKVIIFNLTFFKFIIIFTKNKINKKGDADFTNYLSSKTYNNNENINLDLTSTNNILNGRLDNVLLNGFSNNTALQQEEDLGLYYI